MATGPFSLCLRALFVYVFYAYEPSSFMPTGPRPILLFLYAILNVSPHDMLSLLSLNIARHLDSYPNSLLLDMTSVPRLGSLFAPLHPAPQLLIAIDGPPPEAFYEFQHPQPHPAQLPQAVVVDEAAPEDHDHTYKYWLKGDDPEVASNAIVLIDAATQYSHRCRVRVWPPPLLLPSWVFASAASSRPS